MPPWPQMNRVASPSDHLRDAHVGLMEDHMPRRVAGRVAHIERQFADPHRVALVQPAVGCERPRGVNTIAAPDFLEAVEPELVVQMRPLNRHTELGGENARLARVIDMAVREPDPLDGHPLGERRLP